MAGRIVAVCISEKKGIQKRNIGEAMLEVDHGIVGDAHAGNWHRQVSLLGIESVNKMRAQGLELDFGDFAENLTTEGIDLPALPVGTKLKIGQEVIGEVTQIGKKCHQHCAIYHQVGDCVMPREGIFMKVLQGGKVAVNDQIEVISE